MNLATTISIYAGGVGSGRHRSTTGMKPEKKTVLKTSGVVRLLRLDSVNGPSIYHVSFPQKIGKDDTGKVQEGPLIGEQFLKLDEAEKAFERYDKFFKSQK